MGILTNLSGIPFHIALAATALLCGLPIAVRAVRKLRDRQVGIELLVTIAMIGAAVIGELWEAAAVSVLFLIGEFVERRALRRTRQALTNLLKLLPDTAIVLRNGVAVEVAPDEVRAAEIVRVTAGARIPVDGEVIEGYAAVDESAITGEPVPPEKAVGAVVHAGTICRDGILGVRATRSGADTLLARIIDQIEVAQEERAPMQRSIDRFAQWYTPAIILLAVLVFALTRRLETAMTLLVIGCPGALVIATPAAIMSGIGRAAQRGILIKGGEHLETTAAVSVLALDKTGTITEGKPSLTEVIPLRTNSSDESGSAEWSASQYEIVRWAAIAEAGSGHPFASAIVSAAAKDGPLPKAQFMRVHPGRGVEASYDGHTIAVGNVKLMRESAVALPPRDLAQLEQLRADGKTPVIVAVDGSVVGILALADRHRDSALDIVHKADAIGISRILMLTGDDLKSATAVAERIGIREVHASLLPEQKLQMVQQLKARGSIVAMVGDGINDGPALAQADVGVAMGRGATDLAMETADVVLTTNDLAKLVDAVRISRATVRNIRQNLAIAMLTVAALLIGVLTGSVHMAGGMLVHQLSVFAVTLNATRLLRI